MDMPRSVSKSKKMEIADMDFHTTLISLDIVIQSDCSISFWKLYFREGARIFSDIFKEELCV